MSRTQSEQLFRRAQQHIPGGVNSPVRAFKGVGGTPVFFHRAEGPTCTTRTTTATWTTWAPGGR